MKKILIKRKNWFTRDGCTSQESFRQLSFQCNMDDIIKNDSLLLCNGHIIGYRYLDLLCSITSSTSISNQYIFCFLR